MAAQARRVLAVAALVAVLAAVWLAFPDSIGLVVFTGLSIAAVLLAIGVLAGRASKSRLARTCRALADAFWGIG